MNGKSADHVECKVSFRLYLQAELERRCRINPQYSIRSFAAHLGIQNSALSKILRGVRPISPKMLRRLGAALGIEPSRLESFEQFMPEPSDAKSSLGPIRFNTLAMDSFRFLADWYHLVILELTRIRGFEPSCAWIARHLRISFPETQGAVQRLLRLGLLETDDNGGWKLTGNNSTVHYPHTNQALKRFQKQVLGQAIAAIDEVPIEERDQTTITMAVHKSRLAEAKQKIKSFRREMCKFLEEGDSPDEVYHLTISLFPAKNPLLDVAVSKERSHEIH